MGYQETLVWSFLLSECLSNFFNWFLVAGMLFFWRYRDDKSHFLAFLMRRRISSHQFERLRDLEKRQGKNDGEEELSEEDVAHDSDFGSAAST